MQKKEKVLMFLLCSYCSSLFYLQNLFAAQITSFLRIIYPFVCLKLSTFAEKAKEVLSYLHIILLISVVSTDKIHR